MDLEKEYGIDKETIHTIGEFSVLWSLFEQRLFGSQANPQKIVEWANQVEVNPEVKDLCLNIEEKAVNYLKDIEYTTITNRIYSENRPPNEQQYKLISDFLEGNMNSPFIGCSLFVLRIRNNMFHGLKDIRTLNEQREMFIGINEFLHFILKNNI